MEGEKEIQLRRKVGAPTEASENIENPEETEKEETLSEKALEDDLELNEELDRLPI